MAVSHPRSTNVVPLRRGPGENFRDALETAGERFSDGIRELDRALSLVVDDVDDTVRATRAAFRAAIRAGRVAFKQERNRERVRGPVGLVAGYKPSNNR